ncbi:GntR family transcriptional regulator [Paenibacillus sp. J31TS4]|uniref:MocR-like pyridoxine biosynthesis transcription factor PdxR n=1 Tax=Paenibacillus sp. J31TS4 TaxID=2807195 RepID=UPI001AFEB5FF|nr:PLP-dependent aminotransferase family protein [Paenibacillus sp. J31TS4]GIP38988.1 GntR family transcriptional regulator [Paenibacillus sp. J31TS4]
MEKRGPAAEGEAGEQRGRKRGRPDGGSGPAIPIGFERVYREAGGKTEALYRAVKEAIQDGRLPYRSKVPSTRALAAQYGMSRNTAAQAYDRLLAEGYLAAEPGSGTYVAYRTAAAHAGEPAGAPLALSAWGRRVSGLPSRVAGSPGGGVPISFDTGEPDLAAFPRAQWARCLYAEVRRSFEEPLTGAFAAEGDRSLREAIARHLGRHRGIRAAAADIVVVNGSMQAIALLVQLLVDPGDRVVLEEPGYGGFRSAVEASGGRPLPAEVDARGIVPADWDARLAFVTPGRQFPTGCVLAMERRQAILQWAARMGGFVVEDDYDSEFRHGGRPLEPLKALDREGRVVFIGTFSKTMLPQLRIGYAVLPPGLREAFVRAKRLYEPHPSGQLEQRALAAFLNSGEYERHLRRMRRLYSRKHDVLAGLLAKKLSAVFELVPSEAGLHLFAWWNRSAGELARFQALCREEGVGWVDPAPYFQGEPRPAAVFGFSHLTVEELEEGVARMEGAWRKIAGRA